MAAYGMGVVVAPIIGPTLGGWLTDNYSWRWIFYINIPVGLVALFMQHLFVEDPPYIKQARTKAMDYVGFGFMAIGVGLLQLVLDKGQEADWFAANWICWSTTISVLALVAFVIWEFRTPEPLVNVRLLKNRNYATGVFLIGVLGGILYGTTVLLPIFMQSLLHYTSYITGLAMTPRGVGSLVAMILMGRLIGRIDARYLLMTGFLGLSASCWYLSHLTMEITRSQISWPLVFNGLSMGFIFVPLTTLTVSTLKQSEIFQATGLYALLRNIGGSFGISALVTVQARLSQGHQNVLVANVTPYSAQFRTWLHKAAVALPHIPSPKALYSLAYHELLSQSALLGFMDCLQLVSIAAIMCVPLVFLFRRVRHTKAPGLDH